MKSGVIRTVLFCWARNQRLELSCAAKPDAVCLVAAFATTSPHCGIIICFSPLACFRVHPAPIKWPPLLRRLTPEPGSLAWLWAILVLYTASRTVQFICHPSPACDLLLAFTSALSPNQRRNLFRNIVFLVYIFVLPLPTILFDARSGDFDTANHSLACNINLRSGMARFNTTSQSALGRAMASTHPDIRLPSNLASCKISILPATSYYIPDFITEDEERIILDKVC